MVVGRKWLQIRGGSGRTAGESLDWLVVREDSISCGQRSDRGARRASSSARCSRCIGYCRMRIRGIDGVVACRGYGMGKRVSTQGKVYGFDSRSIEYEAYVLWWVLL